MTQPASRTSDLAIRVASAAVMLVVAGAALWLGGLSFTIFAALIALGVLWEWSGLVARLTDSIARRALWLIAGLAYIGVAAITLVGLRDESLAVALQVLLMVIAVDIGAYFAGRAIGGPKIAPAISPSKTWAGLAGAAVAASLAHAAVMPWTYHEFADAGPARIIGFSLLGGTTVAVIAQAGDFFESWMKRRAGVKDSGSLIPGHGGLFDRTDGLIAVLFAIAVMGVAIALASGDPTPSAFEARSRA